MTEINTLMQGSNKKLLEVEWHGRGLSEEVTAELRSEGRQGSILYRGCLIVFKMCKSIQAKGTADTKAQRERRPLESHSENKAHCEKSQRAGANPAEFCRPRQGVPAATTRKPE